MRQEKETPSNLLYIIIRSNFISTYKHPSNQIWWQCMWCYIIFVYLTLYSNKNLIIYCVVYRKVWHVMRYLCVLAICVIYPRLSHTYEDLPLTTTQKYISNYYCSYTFFLSYCALLSALFFNYLHCLVLIRKLSFVTEKEQSRCRSYDSRKQQRYTNLTLPCSRKLIFIDYH